MTYFVRPSKYRHVYGTCAKRDFCYDNLRVSANAWDTNIVKANPRFISINWQASGGGAFAVVPVSQAGKLPENYPLYRGHTGPVLDTDFNPFNDYVIASGSEDSKVMIWSIPEEYDEGLEQVTPILKLSGHGRSKVGQVLFHPAAENVLASASTDLTIKLWDIEKGLEKQEMTGHTELIQSLAWNYNGSLLATTCRDKKLRIFDVRANKIVQEGPGHQGIKGSRVVWMGNTDRLATTGFSRMSDRQLNLWDATDLSKPLKSEFLDTSSGVIMPFYDPDTKMLYLAGKGDGNIRYYEYDNDELYPLAEFKAIEPQRGMGFMPKRGLNVNECEVARAYKVGTTLIEPISFTVPRKSEAFQSDIFPPCFSDEPALTADEWFEGKDADPKLVDLEAGFIAKAKKEFVPTAAPVEKIKSEMSSPVKEKNYQEAYHEARKENDELKGQLSQRDVKIRVLEIELDKLRSDIAELSLSKKEQQLPHSSNAVVE
ncbi:hypothetical protein G6F62_000764 [Rhizopus arrhizus]|uniref:Coronin n=1 Tax=Rhizopus oryzae TaxID=64495 RepID=A0A9P6XA26_RHIOR|nr:hypothetical protein G6F23_001568 [Rhizopus arrhizus]KAG0763693.1 hypothetical protein G6F24_005815 [Rhizopus arrhizus]KAG0791852.1 hypothetical protein G6F21_004782 [Rhizopus arrhizus]KAG0799617.1 hypothetical protein G6F22_003053 [Rhizopus arrhizus]KAG0811773.1 hypothetical protein G6F20_006898 [Rhizopus arrhizus]